MKLITTALLIIAFVGAFLCGAQAGETSRYISLPVVMDKPVNVTSPTFAPTYNFRTGELGVAVVREFQDPQPTQSFGIAGYYSFCSKKPAVIGMQRIGGINNFFGLGFTPDVSVLLGGDIDGIVRAGGSVTVSWTPNGSNLSLIVGLGADWPLQDFEFRKVGVGVVAGVKYSVRF